MYGHVYPVNAEELPFCYEASKEQQSGCTKYAAVTAGSIIFDLRLVSYYGLCARSFAFIAGNAANSSLKREKYIIGKMS